MHSTLREENLAAIMMKKIIIAFLRATIIPIVKVIYQFTILGEENIPATGGVLLMPNHVTWLDSVLISSACKRPVRFVMYDGFMKNKAIAYFANLFDTVPISAARAKDAIKVVAEALQEGSVVCLFAEGELTRTGTLLEIKRGFELMARKANAPILPLYMDGSWGSIFSFERNCFFKKYPYSLPFGITASFGKILPATAQAEKVRTAIMQCSAAAISERTASAGFSNKNEINAFQLTQVNGILPHSVCMISNSTEENSAYQKTLQKFAQLQKCELLTESELPLNTMQYGDVLFQFIPWENASLEKLAEHALPCLFYGGIILTFSMPHPPRGASTSIFQMGHKENTYGKLLPGFYLLDDKIYGPSLPSDGIIANHFLLDSDGFLMINK